METLTKGRQFVNDFGLWVILGLLVLLWSVVYKLRSRLRRKPRPTMRDVTMTVEGRKLYTDTIFLERLCDTLLECVLRDEISEQEANAKLAIVAKSFRREEIMPLIKAKKSKFLKAQLKANERRRKMNGKTTPLPLPSETSKASSKPKDDGELLASILTV